MISTLHESPHRRDFLQAGLLGLLSGLNETRQVFAEPETKLSGRAKSCILVYLLGGPPHQDMWDLKPEAPAEIRGPFKPIATNVPGIRICEHLPLLASQADQLAIVRSVTYPNNDHPYMIYYTLTGRVSPVPLGENTVLPPNRSDYPHMGSVVSRYAHRNPSVPGYVAIPEVRVRMMAVPVSGGGRAGFLGPNHDPLAVNDDPRQPPAALQLPPDVPAQRFDERQSLLAVLEGCSPRTRIAEEHEAFRRSAGRLVHSGAGRDLFVLDREPAALRERYGSHRFGQSLLLARRLVEAGVSLVGVHFNFMSKCDGWDTHAKNFDCLKGELLPLLDQGLSALLDDLHQRGRLDETLVVCLGEFGRTPRINANAGRDHWGACASVVLAGGGVRGGRVVGASDRIAAYPKDCPLDPVDIQATIYHCLGLHAEQTMYDQLNRPQSLSMGKVLQQVF
jgi:Protein of unknown function (DUF1501)